MNYFIKIALFILLSSSTYAQVKGVVYGSNKSDKKALYGAKLKLLHANTGVITEEDGKFEFNLPKELPDTLVISAMGYTSDTLILNKKDRFMNLEIILYSDQLLPEVLIEIKKGTHSISRLKTLHVEEIGSGELRKAACCNLSESFETNASVDVNITDAVSGAKKIQMMGLDGVYTQIQMENIPYLRGLESSFGLNSISGTWVESIQIVKGNGSVVNGYESMAGLVNLELKKPSSMEKIYVNGYTNMFGREELNLNGGHIINEKWSTGWLAHASTMLGEVDGNKDGFRDIPKGNNLGLLNRWQYHGKRFESQFGVNAYLDNKFGGETGFDRNKTNGLYGVDMQAKHIDVFAKTGFLFEKKPYQSIGVVYNLKYQEVDAKFGNREFAGIEKRGYVNGIFDGIIGNTNNKIKAGASLVYLDMDQKMDSLIDDRLEIVPGVFGEFTHTGLRWTHVIGTRLDYHNLYEEQISPRYHGKFILTESTDLRFTVGKGWRVPNYLIDNISLLASSRAWIASQTIEPEESWNYGGSVIQEFKMFGQKGSFVMDFYRTEFTKQLIVDRDEQLNAVVFKNLEGASFSNAFQAELSVSPKKNLDVRIAYKWLEVRSEFGGLMQQKVMVPKHRGFANVAYTTRNKRWEFDLTTSVFGVSRLPVGILPDGNETTNNTSNTYAMVNAQVTHTYKRFDFYLGGENLTNYKQKDAIIDAQNPFGSYFDATRIWGPVMGVNIYAGFRFSIERKKE